MGLLAKSTRVLSRSIRLLVGSCFVIPLLFGDGGALQFQKQAGPFIVTAFTAPVPVRVGAGDLSVMVQRAADRSPLLDSRVLVTLSRHGEPDIKADATRAQATNKLMYAARIVFPSAGTWHVDVAVNASGSTAHVAGDIAVLPEQPPLMAFWPYFAMLPAAVVLFILNQWLKSRRSVKNPQGRPSPRFGHSSR